MQSARSLAAAMLCLALVSPAHAKRTTHAAKHSGHAAKVEPMGRLVASVYWEGKRVATGRKFDPSGMTVAHRSLPLGTRLLVSYGGSAAEVVVNDRGPFVHGRDIDLTRGVARALHFSGVGKISVAYWPPVPRPRPAELVEVSDKQ
jgi:rare lipoprotein A